MKLSLTEYVLYFASWMSKKVEKKRQIDFAFSQLEK